MLPNATSPIYVEAKNLPSHVGIIMDGNGRWAQLRGLDRSAGHREGSKVVRKIVRAARRVGIRALTLYAFSEQNWARPEGEVGALMELLSEFLISERDELLNNGIRLNAVGNLSRLPSAVRELLEPLRADSSDRDGMTLTLALSERIPSLSVGDPDLVIRTGGDRRISNFLLYGLAYAELHFADVLWPEFTENDLYEAIASYQGRERRYGLVGTTPPPALANAKDPPAPASALRLVG